MPSMEFTDIVRIKDAWITKKRMTKYDTDLFAEVEEEAVELFSTEVPFVRLLRAYERCCKI